MVTFREVFQASSRCPAGSSGDKRWKDSASQIPLMLFLPGLRLLGPLMCRQKGEQEGDGLHPSPRTCASRNALGASNPSIFLGPFMEGSRLNTELGREELIWSYLLSCDFNWWP